jgi:hypothetical protein
MMELEKAGRDHSSCEVCMLSVECSCGRSFEVSHALAGKRVTCPDCGEVISVSAAAPAAAIKKKTPSRPVFDVGETVEVDEVAERAPANSKKMWIILALLAGGGMFLFFGAVVAAGLVWFFLLRESGTSELAAEIEPQGHEVAFKLFAPRKPGDLRLVTLTAEEMRSIGIAGPEGISVNMPAQKVKARLQCRIRTLECDLSGWETKVEVTGVKAVLTFANEEKQFPGDKGDSSVYIGTLSKTAQGRTMRFREKDAKNDLEGDFAKFLSWACVRDVTGVSITDDDVLFGPSQKQAVGASWEVIRAPAEELFVGGFVPRAKIDEAKATLVQVASAEGFDVAIVEVKLAGVTDMINDAMPNGMVDKQTGSIDATFSYHVPLVHFEGPVQWSCKMESKKVTKLSAKAADLLPKVEGLPAKQGDLKITGSGEEKLVAECKLEIVYLPSESPAIEKAPSIPTATTPEKKPEMKLSMRLLNPKVEWISGQAALRAESAYRIYAGKPRPDARYVLYATFAGAEGQRSRYKIQEFAGAAVATDGKFAAGAVPVAYPPADATNVCDLLLLEETPGNPGGDQLDLLRKVAVQGVAPIPPAPTGKPPIMLSNAKVERTAKKTILFSVDYEFTDSSPEPTSNYQMVARLSGTKINIRQPIIVQGKGSIDWPKRRTIAKEMPIDSSIDTTFEMWVNEITPSNQAGQKVSNVLKGSAVGNAPDNVPQPTPAPQFQIASVGIKKLQAGAMTTIQWNLQKGQINPQAVYIATVEFKGNKKSVGQQPIFKLPGSQMQAMGSQSGQVIYLGEKTFEVLIWEIPPGAAQQPRLVSEKYNGRLPN